MEIVPRKTCTWCQETGVDMAKGSRCKHCEALRSRLVRRFEDDTDISSTINAMDVEKRTCVCKDLQAKFGNDLDMAFRQELTRTEEATVNMSMKGTGQWLDAEDMQEKHKNKPQMLQSIMNNTRSFKDPISETVLYEDMAYTSTTEEAHSRSSKHTLSFEHNGVLKKKMQKKENKEKPAVEAGERPLVALTTVQQEQIGKLLEKFVKTAERLTNKLNDAQTDKLKDLIPQRVIRGAQSAKAELTKTRAEMEFATEHGSVSFKELKAATNETLELVKHSERRFDLHIADASEELEADAD